jgi:hypothetical protein
MTKFEELYHKLLTDAAFRVELYENPSAALTSIGIKPTPELLQAIGKIFKGVGEVDRLLGDPECVT